MDAVYLPLPPGPISSRALSAKGGTGRAGFAELTATILSASGADYKPSSSSSSHPLWLGCWCFSALHLASTLTSSSLRVG